MKLRVFLLCLASSLACGQGVFVPQQTALKIVNGLTTPIANATITVCAANASGIPCAPALTNTIFSNAALTQPLSNPFTADAQGNYQFAVAPGIYTVTVTAVGFAGNSYQVTAGNGGVGGGGGGTATWPTITGGVSNGQTFTLGSSNMNLGGTGGLDLSLGNPLTAFKIPIGASAAPVAAGVFAYDSTAAHPIFGNGTLTVRLVGLFGSTPGNGNCAKFSSSGTSVDVQDSGAACGVPVALQTNGVNNASQSALNFLNSSTNAVGLTVTPSNPAVGNEQFEITGSNYLGNAAGLHVVQSGLMAEYLMNEGSGTTLNDNSGSGNNATLCTTTQTPTWNSGPKLGLTFAGASNQCVTLPAALNNARAWVFVYSYSVSNNFASSSFAPLLWQTGTPAAGPVWGLTFWKQLNQTAFGDQFENRYWISDFSSSGQSEISSSGQGTHVLIWSCDNPDHFFLDGTEFPFYTAQGNKSANCGPGANNWKLGSGPYQSASFTGQMYYAAAYNRVLTLTEMSQISQVVLFMMRSRGLTIPENGDLVSNTNNYIVDGDSIACGGAECVSSATPWPMKMTLTPAATIINTHKSGMQMITNIGPQGPYEAANYYTKFGNYQAFVQEACVNDYGAGSKTVAQCMGAYIQQAVALRSQGYKFFSWAQMGQSAQRDNHNTFMRLHWPEFSDGFIDGGSDPNLGCSTCGQGVTTPGNAFFYDNIHPSPYGGTFLAYFTQRMFNRYFGPKDFTSATIYNAAAPAATAVTAASDTAAQLSSVNSTATYTFASNPFAVGQLVTCTGITPAGYNTSILVLTSNATQITGMIGTNSLAAGSVFGSCSAPQIEDRYAILNFGAGNATLSTACGYTGQFVYIKNINAAASTLVAWQGDPAHAAELFDATGTSNLTVAANSERIIQATVTTPTTPVCGWRVIQ